VVVMAVVVLMLLSVLWRSCQAMHVSERYYSSYTYNYLALVVQKACAERRFKGLLVTGET
jgi:hypothetical protein